MGIRPSPAEIYRPGRQAATPGRTILASEFTIDSPASPAPIEAGPRPPRASTTLRLLYAVVFLLAGLVAWSGRIPNSDFFMGLAGGEDVSAGRLGKPDTHSYITEGRVWINQSWLTGWALNRLWRLGGPASAVVARSLLLALLATGMAAWLRTRRASWPAIALAIASALVVCRYYLTLRGNLVSITALPWLLWLLERQRVGAPHWAWAVGSLMAVWAQCHGGHIFGWAVVFLWLGVHLIPAVLRQGPWTMRRWLMLAIALPAAVGVSVIASPFDPKLLFTLPFTMAQQSEWRTIHEWWPLIGDGSTPDLQNAFEETGPYLIYLVGLLVLGIAACIVYDYSRSAAPMAALPVDSQAPSIHDTPAPDPPPPRELAVGSSRSRVAIWSRGAFDIALAGVTVAMAFTGRRFVPLSIITLSPLLATVLDTLWTRPPPTDRTDDARRVGLAAGIVGAVVAVALAVALYPMIVLGYSREHPLYPPQTIFERQFMGNAFPAAAARFMRAHHIDGRVFHSYQAETYLLWAVPGIQVNCGGRAQQIYTEANLKASRFLRNIRLLRDRRGIAEINDYFARHGVGAIVLGAGSDWEMVQALIDSTEWLPVLFDGDWCLLVHQNRFENLWVMVQDAARHAIVDPRADPDGARAAAEVAAGKIVFPDELTRRRTVALFLTSPRLTGQADVPEEQAKIQPYIFRARWAAIDSAQALHPSALLYGVLDRLARQRPGAEGDIREFLEGEWRRLGAIPRVGARSADLLRCRAEIASLLGPRYRTAGDQPKADAAERNITASLAELARLGRWWQL